MPKKQKGYHSGKQKCHTLQAQVMIEFESEQMIYTAIAQGRTDDFKLLKQSRLPLVSTNCV
jgi:hypothetical protein